jgi:hypothetical protein
MLENLFESSILYKALEKEAYYQKVKIKNVKNC